MNYCLLGSISLPDVMTVLELVLSMLQETPWQDCWETMNLPLKVLGGSFGWLMLRFVFLLWYSHISSIFLVEVIEEPTLFKLNLWQGNQLWAAQYLKVVLIYMSNVGILLASNSMLSRMLFEITSVVLTLSIIYLNKNPLLRYQGWTPMFPKFPYLHLSACLFYLCVVMYKLWLVSRLIICNLSSDFFFH